VVMGLKFGQMEATISAASVMELSKAKVFISGQMAPDIRENG